MESYYESRVAEFGDPPGSGFCDDAERAENAFIHPRWPAVHEVGRLLCFRDARGAPCSISTDRRVEVAVEAQRREPTNEQLYRLSVRVEFGPLARADVRCGRVRQD